MHTLLQFLRDVYFTGFAIIFRKARVRQVGYKVGSAVCILTMVEWLIFNGIFLYVQMDLRKRVLLSKPTVVFAFLGLFSLNQFVVFFRRRGITFAHEFDSLEKTRRIILTVSCVIVTIAAIVFFIFSAIAYRRFIGAG